jgi:hypothetical protein
MGLTREARLKALFHQKQSLEQQLRETNALIQYEGNLYWQERGYTVMPRIEKLRAAILG